MAQDLNVDELRNSVYATALNLKLPVGKCFLMCAHTCIK